MNIGGLVRKSIGKVFNPFLGRIDEVRVSNVRRVPAQVPRSPYAPDPGTVALFHFNEGSGTPRDSSNILRPVAPPGRFELQGTSYAVHDFLERYCGVRWYGPTELGLVLKRGPTLAVVPRNIRRRPAFLYRQPYPVYPSGIARTLWERPTPREMVRFWARHKVGGEKYACNHSFYGFYDRFWKKNPRRPELFERAQPDWFARGFSGRPPQMCYSNEEFIQQVIKDASDYFGGKGIMPGARAAGDYFALVPMDNGRWCRCPACQEHMNQDEKENPQFSNGYASDYVFGFADRVAKAINKKFPGKYISTIAYATYAYYPRRVKLRENISVQLCLHVRNWWVPSVKRNDLAIYNDWISKEKGRRLFLWLYYCFPEAVASKGGWHCFPGFFAHTLARQIRMFARDGIRGAFLNGLGEQVDTYVTLKMLDDPSVDVDRLLDSFFNEYYGAAAQPMKKLYLRIEQIYSDPANYPREVRKENRHFHQNEKIAWGFLGTAERMAELGKLMEEAIKSARTQAEKERVALFKEGVWDYMVEGRKRYAQRLALEPFRQKLKSKPPPKLRVPRVPAANGDPAKVDWTKAALIEPWYDLEGYPAPERKVIGHIAHDTRFLYIWLQEEMDARGLVSRDVVWMGDDWELFFAGSRSKPYRQVAVGPNGRCVTVTYGRVWNCDVRATSETTAEAWNVKVAVSLACVIPRGVEPGARLFANFYRASPKASRLLAWSPNFKRNFHELSRLGELILEPDEAK